jgi:hypothetical protein
MSTYSDDSDSILGDNGYEVLTDSSLMSDEEEDDGSSSIASLDENAGNNSSAMGDSIESLAGLTPADSDHHDPNPIPTFGGLDEQPLDDSRLTLRQSHSFPDEIVFNEPEEASADHVSVCHYITGFNENETQKIYQFLLSETAPPQSLFATVRMTISKSLLEIDEPFRILYAGSAAAKDEIQNKLATALFVAMTDSKNSSGSWDCVKSPRFNIIPISSFGSDGTSPEVELVENSGLDMMVDVCTAAKAWKHEEQPDTLSLWLNGNQNISSSCGDRGVRLENPGWKLPHLAVVYCSDDDNVQRRMTRDCVQTFIERHNVPTLLISQNPHYYKTTDSSTPAEQSIHVCVESDTPETGQRIYKRLPIDLSTFLSINPRQMNRNLGYFTGLTTGSRPARLSSRLAEGQSIGSAVDRVEKERHQDGNTLSSFCWARENSHHDLWKQLLVGWIFFCGLLGAALGVAYLKLEQSSDLPSVQSIQASHTTLVSSAAPPSNTIILGSTSTVPPRLTTDPFVDSGNKIQGSAKVDGISDRFHCQIVGRNRIIIRPPQSYSGIKQPPALFVRVTRGQDATINAEFLKDYDGVYTLLFDDDEVWGVMSVSIWTQSDPILKETIEISFGSRWNNLSTWLKVVDGGRVGLQTILDQATIDAKYLAADLSQTAGIQAAEIKTAAVSKAKYYSKTFSKKLVKLCNKTRGFQQQLNPSRKSKYIRLAQQKAKTIWQQRKKVKGKERVKSKRCRFGRKRQ